MSDDDHILTSRTDASAPIPFAPPRRRLRRDRGGRRVKPKVRKLRLLALLAGLGALAAVSTIFGMMMAVASDLPQLENKQQYRHEVNSYLYDDHWRPIGIFAPPNHDVIDSFQQLGPMMRRAIVSVEDKRFWTDPGVDIRGIGRAFLADVTGSSTQGASTIAEQFVKNALSEQSNRTVFEKLREAALAYHLTREWPRAKILREYLNSIYFGGGAYGAESAARVFFGKAHGFDPNAAADGAHTGCGDSPLPSCASVLKPYEAALLAGMVANPSAFDPLAHPLAATERRDLVLQDMLAQHDITQAEYDAGRVAPLPMAKDIEQPEEPPAAPYFTSWLVPQILSAVGRGVPARVAEYRAYYGGLKIRTTIDLPMQQAAEAAITANLPSGSGEPAASLVAIDNRTGQVRAMVGGPLVDGHQDYQQFPFNLATEGQRQPGSSFKPFTLAVALQRGFAPYSVIDSHPLNLIVPNSAGKEHFIVHNFGNTYSGSITLADATDISDNTVFTQVGLDPRVGTRRVARMARALGIRSPISTNYSMILGGLKVGVSPLDMAHAYETFAENGLRVYSPGLGAPSEGPTGIAQIQCLTIACHGQHELFATPHYRRVLPVPLAQTIHTMLEGVVTNGTGTAAAISGVVVAGKTGTTQNYGDAWFVGWTPQITTAVWVGYPNKLVPMTTLYNGAPVEGGTFPAHIWHDFMTSALQILNNEKLAYGPHPKAGGHGGAAGAGTGTTGATGTAPAPSGAGTGTAPSSHSATTPAGGTGSTPAGGAGAGTGTTPAAPTGTTPAVGAGTTPAGGAGTTPAGGSGGGTGGGGGGTGGGTGGAGIGGGG